MKIKSLLFLAVLWVSPEAFPLSASFSKVMIVVFENEDYGKALEHPFFAKLAARGALLSNFHGVAHPSQPNYIAMAAGDTHGCPENDLFDTSAHNITDLLARRGRTWKVYAEGYPGNCFRGMTSGRYARRHNPFISFRSIQEDPEKCARIVNASELSQDVENNTLADYSFYIPDVYNDGHDTSVKYADAWYAKTFGPLIANQRFMSGMLLVSTFDESSVTEPTNKIYTSFLGEGVRAGAVSDVRYDHYSLLRTIEEAWGLGTLAEKDKKAVAISDVWVNPVL